MIVEERRAIGGDKRRRGQQGRGGHKEESGVSEESEGIGEGDRTMCAMGMHRDASGPRRGGVSLSPLSFYSLTPRPLLLAASDHTLPHSPPPHSTPCLLSPPSGLTLWVPASLAQRS
jgi:hypothetical protein